MLLDSWNIQNWDYTTDLSQCSEIAIAHHVGFDVGVVPQKQRGSKVDEVLC